MMAASKRAEAFAPTLSEHRLAGRSQINPTSIGLTMVSNTPPPAAGAMSPVDQSAALDLVWGAKNIAHVLGVSTRACFHMLESGALPCCRQVGQRWVASRKALKAFFDEAAA